MEICSSGHDEVCFETRRCPACELVKERDAEAKGGDEKGDIISALEEKLDAANERIAALNQAAEENA